MATSSSRWSSVFPAVWCVWSIPTSLGFFVFALRIIAPVSPDMGGRIDVVVWGICAVTFCVNAVAGVIAASKLKGS